MAAELSIHREVGLTGNFRFLKLATGYVYQCEVRFRIDAVTPGSGPTFYTTWRTATHADTELAAALGRNVTRDSV